MMRDDTLNLHVCLVTTEITDLSSHVCSTDEDESKRIVVHKTLSQSFSTDEGESKRSIFNETLSQNCSAVEEKKSYTEEDKS